MENEQNRENVLGFGKRGNSNCGKKTVKSVRIFHNPKYPATIITSDFDAPHITSLIQKFDAEYVQIYMQTSRKKMKIHEGMPNDKYFIVLDDSKPDAELAGQFLTDPTLQRRVVVKYPNQCNAEQVIRIYQKKFGFGTYQDTIIEQKSVYSDQQNRNECARGTSSHKNPTNPQQRKASFILYDATSINNNLTNDNIQKFQNPLQFTNRDNQITHRDISAQNRVANSLALANKDSNKIKLKSVSKYNAGDTIQDFKRETLKQLAVFIVYDNQHQSKRYRNFIESLKNKGELLQYKQIKKINPERKQVLRVTMMHEYQRILKAVTAQENAKKVRIRKYVMLGEYSVEKFITQFNEADQILVFCDSEKICAKVVKDNGADNVSNATTNQAQMVKLINRRCFLKGSHYNETSEEPFFIKINGMMTKFNKENVRVGNQKDQPKLSVNLIQDFVAKQNQQKPNLSRVVSYQTITKQGINQPALSYSNIQIKYGNHSPSAKSATSQNNPKIKIVMEGQSQDDSDPIGQLKYKSQNKQQNSELARKPTLQLAFQKDKYLQQQKKRIQSEKNEIEKQIEQKLFYLRHLQKEKQEQQKKIQQEIQQRQNQQEKKRMKLVQKRQQAEIQARQKQRELKDQEKNKLIQERQDLQRKLQDYEKKRKQKEQACIKQKEKKLKDMDQLNQKIKQFQSIPNQQERQIQKKRLFNYQTQIKEPAYQHNQKQQQKFTLENEKDNIKQIQNDQQKLRVNSLNNHTEYNPNHISYIPEVSIPKPTDLIQNVNTNTQRISIKPLMVQAYFVEKQRVRKQSLPVNMTSQRDGKKIDSHSNNNKILTGLLVPKLSTSGPDEVNIRQSELSNKESQDIIQYIGPRPNHPNKELTHRIERPLVLQRGKTEPYRQYVSKETSGQRPPLGERVSQTPVSLMRMPVLQDVATWSRERPQFNQSHFNQNGYKLDNLISQSDRQKRLFPAGINLEQYERFFENGMTVYRKKPILSAQRQQITLRYRQQPHNQNPIQNKKRSFSNTTNGKIGRANRSRSGSRIGIGKKHNQSPSGYKQNRNSMDEDPYRLITNSTKSTKRQSHDQILKRKTPITRRQDNYFTETLTSKSPIAKETKQSYQPFSRNKYRLNKENRPLQSIQTFHSNVNPTYEGSARNLTKAYQQSSPKNSFNYQIDQQDVEPQILYLFPRSLQSSSLPNKLDKISSEKDAVFSYVSSKHMLNQVQQSELIYDLIFVFLDQGGIEAFQKTPIYDKMIELENIFFVEVTKNKPRKLKDRQIVVNSHSQLPVVARKINNGLTDIDRMNFGNSNQHHTVSHESQMQIVLYKKFNDLLNILASRIEIKLTLLNNSSLKFTKSSFFLPGEFVKFLEKQKSPQSKQVTLLTDEVGLEDVIDSAAKYIQDKPKSHQVKILILVIPKGDYYQYSYSRYGGMEVQDLNQLGIVINWITKAELQEDYGTLDHSFNRVQRDIKKSS